MTDNEIKKALEYHSNTDIATCKDCPMNNISKCGYKLSKLALDLINRQQAEIETLRVNVKASKRIIQRLKERILMSKTEAIKMSISRIAIAVRKWMPKGEKKND